MTRVTIICLVITLANGQFLTLSNTDVNKLKNSVSEAKKYLNNLSVHEDAAVFFGNNKAGKSTLINYLIGNILTTATSKFHKKTIVKVDINSNGPKINDFILGYMKKPTKWTSRKLPNLTLWETTPVITGVDNKVEIVTNEIYIYELLKSVKSLKIVLVVDFNDIKDIDDIRHFTELIDNVGRIFDNKFQEYFPAVSVIFTKVPEHIPANEEIKITQEIIKHILNSYLESIEISVSRNFILYLLDNLDRIALFKQVTDDGIVSSSIDVNIIPTINNSRSIKENCLQEINLGDVSSKISIYNSNTLAKILSKEDEKTVQK